tara:strand:+ start:458 stop:766 length:309 start_codon:yes stop_codon:yes gene_type:complete
MVNKKLPSLTTPHFTSNGKGYQMTFKNGYCVSVQFGPGNYCERRGAGFDAVQTTANNGEVWRSKTAEVAIFNPDGTFDGDVQGWLNPDEVAEIITQVQGRIS